MEGQEKPLQILSFAVIGTASEVGMRFSFYAKKPIRQNFSSQIDIDKVCKFLTFAKSEKLQVLFNGKPLNLNIEKILKS